MSAVFLFRRLSSSLNKMCVCVMFWFFFLVSGRDPVDISSLHNILVK